MAALPKVTVIIPTRDRPDTLAHTLRTCTIQDYDRLEIVVSDNFGDARTADVIAAVRDPRVRGIRTPERLGMSQNWEFALGHVEDGFVLVVGDDDGLLPNSVHEIVEILTETNCQAMGWREAKYHWPGCGGPVQDNTLRFNLRMGWTVRDARHALMRVLQYQQPYDVLPSLYWGVIHRDALRRASSANGRFFHSLNPDVYSAIATTMVVDRYVWSERPYRLNGHSRHSTGASFANTTPVARAPGGQFLREGNLEFHRDCVLVPSPPVYVAEAFRQAREHIPDGTRWPEQPLEEVLQQMVRVAAQDTEGVYPRVAEGVLEMARRAGKESLASALLASHPYDRPSRPGARYAGGGRPSGLTNWSMKLRGADFGIYDIHGAAVLCYSVIRLFEAGYLSPRGLARRILRAVKGRLSPAA